MVLVVSRWLSVGPLSSFTVFMSITLALAFAVIALQALQLKRLECKSWQNV